SPHTPVAASTWEVSSSGWNAPPAPRHGCSPAASSTRSARGTHSPDTASTRRNSSSTPSVTPPPTPPPPTPPPPTPPPPPGPPDPPPASPPGPRPRGRSPPVPVSRAPSMPDPPAVVLVRPVHRPAVIPGHARIDRDLSPAGRDPSAGVGAGDRIVPLPAVMMPAARRRARAASGP